MTDTIVLNDPNDRKKLKDAVEDGVNMKTRIKELQDQLKDIIDYIHGELGVDKKVARRVITTAFKDDYFEKATENEAWENLVHIVGDGE